MHEFVAFIENPRPDPLAVWFEPWATGLFVPPQHRFKLVASGEREGSLEIDYQQSKVVVYGWPTSTLAVFIGEAKVHSFSVPVPEIPANMTMKSFVQSLFGSPPDPQPHEIPQRAPKRPWWKFWQRGAPAV